MTVSPFVVPAVSRVSDHETVVAGASHDVVIGRGMSESPTPFLNIPSNMTEDECTPDEWEEVKQQVLKKICAYSLDTPEAHLSFVRKQLAFANACYV
jgi:hypothetical protein